MVARISALHAEGRDRGFALRLPEETNEFERAALERGVDAPDDVVSALSANV